MKHFYLIDFSLQAKKTNITHFVYIHDGYVYASRQQTDIAGFEFVPSKGSVTLTIEPGGCIQLFVRRHFGYAIICKFNPSDQAITYTFTSDFWYAYALNPNPNDVLSFFTDVGPYDVPATSMFVDYTPSADIYGELTYYQDMVDALSVVWSPGLNQGLQFSTEYNIELYDDMFKFNFVY